MEQGPAAPRRPGSARERLAAAVRDDAGGRPPPSEPGAAHEPPPVLPPDEGLEPVRRLGRASWLVREARSGELFVLRPCAGPPEDPGRSPASGRALVMDLAGLDHPHVVAVRGLVGPGTAPAGFVEDFLPGGSLAERLALHGRPDPTVLAPVLRDAAAGLAELHGRGRHAAGLTARRILFRAVAGPPGPAEPGGPGASSGSAEPFGVLRWPAAAVRVGTGPGDPQDDVRDLGAVGWTALTGRAPAADVPGVSLALLRPDAPPGLVGALEAALAPEPAARPTAARLAALLAAPGEPAAHTGGHRTAPGGGAGGRRGTAARAAGRPGRPSRPPPRTAALVAGAVLLGAAAVFARGADAEPPPPVAATAPAAPEPSAPRPTTSSGAPPGGAAAGVPPDRVRAEDPRAALDALVARRGKALRTGDSALLDQVYAPGAEAAATDREIIARASGAQTFAELVLEVGRARQLPPDPGAPGRVAFAVEVRVDGYRGDPGSDPSVVPAGNGWVQSVTVVLVDTGPGWRLADVAPTVPDRAPGADPSTEGPRR